MRWLPFTLLLMLVGCRSVQYVPVETTNTDSVYIVQHTIDSVTRVDSIFIKEYAKGDTIIIEQMKWRYRDRYKMVVDTMLVERVDSVQVPYPVEKKLTKWQCFKQDVGGIALGVATGALILIIVMWIRKAKGV